MKEKENRNNHVTLRLTYAEYEPFKQAMEALGQSKSEFFRLQLTAKLNPEIHNKKRDRQYIELIRLFNKTSNNMNQIAKQFNTLAKSGTITEHQALLCLNALNRISDNLLNGLDHVSKD